MNPDEALVFRPLPGRAVFWCVVAVVWAAFLVFYVDMIVNDPRSPPPAFHLITLAIASSTLVIAGRVVQFTSRLEIDELAIRLTGPFVRREIRWEDVRSVQVGSAQGSVTGLVIGGSLGAFGVLAGSTLAQAGGSVVARAADHAEEPEGVPIIEVRGRDRASSLYLTTCYGWEAAEAIRSMAAARQSSNA